MQTIAITNWDTIVSPLYDASCSLLIIGPDGNSESVDVRHMSLFDKADICAAKGVSVLICGAISTTGCAILQDKNIKVLSWIRGSISDVIEAYKNNADLTDSFFMPGCSRGLCKRSGRLRHRGGQCGLR